MENDKAAACKAIGTSRGRNIVFPRQISRTRKFATQHAVRSIIETAQDAYTLVLEMSRPEPNTQICDTVWRKFPTRAICEEMVVSVTRRLLQRFNRGTSMRRLGWLIRRIWPDDAQVSSAARPNDTRQH